MVKTWGPYRYHFNEDKGMTAVFALSDVSLQEKWPWVK